VFLITNQPGIAKGIILDYEAVNAGLEQLLKDEQLRLDGIYTCPHTEHDGCQCRKPSPYLIRQALTEHNLQPKRIYTVGDRLHDAEMAAAVGGIGFLVRTGFGQSEMIRHKNDAVYRAADDAEDAVRQIIMLERANGRNILPVPQYRWPEISDETEKTVCRQLYTSLSIRTNSGTIDQLEKNWAVRLNRRYAIAYSSGTMALFAAFCSIGLHEGDEVIAPAYGYFASVSSLLIKGVSIRFADTDNSGNLPAAGIEKLITARTRAIVVTHLYGAMSDCREIRLLADKYRLKLIEDASHALGASDGTFLAGTVGDVSVFSLQANKLAPAGEGGILLTDDLAIAQTAATIGHFRQYSQKLFTGAEEQYPFLMTGMGFKLRIHPLAAAIGIVSLANVDEVRAGRKRCAEKMMAVLSPSGLKTTGPVDKLSLYNLPLLLPEWAAGKADYISAEMKKHGFTADFNHNSNCILPSLPIFHTPNYYYPDNEKAVFDDYANAERFAGRIFLLPLWHREYEHEIGLAYAKELSAVLDQFKEEENA
jgi:HAD superfamily hydrolase (TIGR01662 family)